MFLTTWWDRLRLLWSRGRAGASGESPKGAPEGWHPRLSAGVHSVIGNVREHNEDSYYIPGYPPVIRYNSSISSAGNFDPTVEMSPPNGPKFVFVVADGMGGQQAGEQASQMAIEIIPHQVAKRMQPGVEHDRAAVREVVRESVAKANEDILALAGLGPEYANMGTTCVVALFHQHRAYVAGIGDSRVYRLRGGVIEQLTKDHSLAKALEEAGTIRPEEVATHKFSHVLYLYLGSRDAKDGPDQIRDMEISPGDIFVLATDGLTGVVSDEQIVEVLMTEPDPQKAAYFLVNLALEQQSKDNITCAVVHVD